MKKRDEEDLSENMEVLEEKRKEVEVRELKYKKKSDWYCNARAKAKKFMEGDLVLKNG